MPEPPLASRRASGRPPTNGSGGPSGSTPTHRVNRLSALVEGLRPRQWVKNLFLFAGLVFTGNVGNSRALLTAWDGFALFCVLSSALYLFNDVWDRQEDRRHPVKRRRPVASGRLTTGFALLASLALTVAGLVGAWGMGRGFFYAAAAFVALTLAYTVALKRVVILDLLLIAANFVLRAAAGALAIHVKISPWLLILTTLIALFLGLGKRRNELIVLDENPGRHRRSLDDYTLPFVDQMLSVVTAATLVSYALYAFNSETATRRHGMMLTSPFVLYGLFRYLYLIHVKGKGGSPETSLLEDPPSLINFALWTLTVLAVFRFGR